MKEKTSHPPIFTRSRINPRFI